jgi:hypothetical protein
MKKKIDGYVVCSRGGLNGFCMKEPPENEGVLWLGGYGFVPALFKTRKEAKKAIYITEKYARSKDRTPADSPLWFDHSISPVREV